MNISEIFYSIEGEGIAIGKPEVFVRLSGCNLSCSWCDTKYAWENGSEKLVDQVLAEIFIYPCKNVSITGGEPLLQRHELLELVIKLKSEGFWIQINTNGTLFDEAIFKLADLISMDCKCPSSRMKSDLSVLAKVKELFNQKTQFKFIIADEQDFTYAKKVLSELKCANAVFQPEWNNKRYVKKLVDQFKSDAIDARIILQQHKIIWRNKKGV